MSNKFTIKKDRYSKARGGHSRFLDINCSHCGNHICFYQKDGPGILKRMYLDRIHEFDNKQSKQFICPSCNSLLGTLIIYEKEHRLAYRLFVGAIEKKIAKNKIEG